MGMLKYIVDKLFSNDQEVVVVGEGGIESGSNSNGSWTKFPDGTMIQYGFGSAYFSGDFVSQKNILFPMPFIDTDYFSSAMTDRIVNETGREVFNYSASRDATVDGCKFSFINDQRIADTGSESFRWQAIGRWK